MANNPFANIKPWLVKHEPEILMGLGISGLVFSTIWGVKATIKAVNTVKTYKENKNIEKVTPKEEPDTKGFMGKPLGENVEIKCDVG